MKLWKLTAPRSGWGTYDSAVVAAETEEAARETHPNPAGPELLADRWAIVCIGEATYWPHGDWPSPFEVTVTYLGDAAPGIEAGVIVASYNPE